MSSSTTMRFLARTCVALWILVQASHSAFAAEAVPASRETVLRSVSGAYQDIRDQLVFSIQEKGLVVSNILEVGDMLERTGKDLGFGRPVFSDASLVQFCSAVIAHEAVAVDPNAISLCPYTIAVYALAAEPGKVYLSYRQLITPDMSLELQATLRKAESLLDDVVSGAME
ncbi:MAG: DUF302 domain-containing protein [Betaproteobacteria bacterium]|nr:DUF302 domain-containing protein [Betaproteobacteria bacterium]